MQPVDMFKFDSSFFSTAIGSQRTLSSKSIKNKELGGLRMPVIGSCTVSSLKPQCAEDEHQQHLARSALLRVHENHYQGNLTFHAFASKPVQVEKNVPHSCQTSTQPQPENRQEVRPSQIGIEHGGAINTATQCNHTRGSFEDNQERKQALLEYVFVSSELQIICNIDFEFLPPLQILELMTADKTTSLAFQQFIMTCWFDQFPTIKAVTLAYLDGLIGHQLGNYVVQKLLLRDPQIRERTEALCKKNFDIYCQDEYASRVMQVLVEASPVFRAHVLQRFRQDPWSCVANIAAVFLASVVIKFSDDIEDVSFVRFLTGGQLKDVLICKNMKRILMTYCECAPLAVLDDLFSELGLYQGLAFICNNKILTYVFLSFLFREHPLATQMLVAGMQTQFSCLQKTKFFRFLLERAIKSRSHPRLSAFVKDLLACSLKIHPGTASKNDRFLHTLLMSEEAEEEFDQEAIRNTSQI